MHKTTTPPEDGRALLTVDKLSVSFGSGAETTQVTHDISFTVDRHQTVALVGESGSGKSVSAMSIIGLLPDNATPTGSVQYEGRELLGMKPTALDKVRASDISVIFQDPMTALNPVYTVHQLMEDAFFGQGLTSAEVTKRGIELLEQVGLPEPEQKIHQYPHQLSGGQRQRVMIAMAISSKPGLLIADEPTTALDVTVQAEILDLLKDLQSQYGMGLLLITHDMGVVADVADQVHVMKDGRVVESATMQRIFHNPQDSYTKQLMEAVPKLGSVELSDASNAESQQPSMSFQNAVVEFPRRRQESFRAIDGVSFELYPGEVLGLVGESGSGKSTLGRVAVGLQKLAEGTARIAGIDLQTAKRKDIKAMRRDVAVVFQDPASSLDPRMTIEQSVSSPLKWNKILTSSKALRARAAELLDLVKIAPSWGARYPHELSGGQRQRIGIARALALEPQVLIADEPTSALDVSVQARVLELLKDLQENLGFSCLFISHDLAVVEMLADRVVVLRNGQVVESGTTHQVLHEPKDAYTKRLVAAAPVPDPELQKLRREKRLAIKQES